MDRNDSTVVTKESSFKKYAIYAAILLVVFLLGLVPMWYQKSQVAYELQNTKTQLRKMETENLLTTSYINVRAGKYETARQSMSSYFTRLDTEIEKGKDGFFTDAQRENLKPVLNERDSTITMLAQRDQAAAERLGDMYMNYRKAIGETVMAEPAQPTQ